MNYKPMKKHKWKNRLLLLLFVLVLLFAARTLINTGAFAGQTASLEHGWKNMLIP